MDFPVPIVSASLHLASFGGASAAALTRAAADVIAGLLLVVVVPGQEVKIRGFQLGAAGAGGKWLGMLSWDTDDISTSDDKDVSITEAFFSFVESTGEADQSSVFPIYDLPATSARLGDLLEREILTHAGPGFLAPDVHQMQIAGCNTGHRFIGAALCSIAPVP